MKRLALSVCVLLLALTAAPAAGQNLYVLVGPSFPIGDFGEYANTGLHAAGGATFAVSNRVDLYGEAFWGQNSHEGEGDSKTNPYGFMAGALFEVASGAAVEPYVFGGAGMMWHKYSADSGGFSEDSSESAFGFQVGGGLGFDVGALHAFGEARFMTASFEAESPGLEDESTAFLAVTVGLALDVGGGGN
ncbi:MAG: outer membrane beta-barrel protein [Gemmatimonadetes bacterium]|nr:outer membrane beta-barrel protein [Gemmatimonadota bacterium]